MNKWKFSLLELEPSHRTLGMGKKFQGHTWLPDAYLPPLKTAHTQIPGGLVFTNTGNQRSYSDTSKSHCGCLKKSDVVSPPVSQNHSSR